MPNSPTAKELIELFALLDELFALLDQAPGPPMGEGGYAELVDENDEQGPVRICDKNGNVKMLMSREVWDALRKSEK